MLLELSKIYTYTFELTTATKKNQFLAPVFLAMQELIWNWNAIENLYSSLWSMDFQNHYFPKCILIYIGWGGESFILRSPWDSLWELFPLLNLANHVILNKPTTQGDREGV